VFKKKKLFSFFQAKVDARSMMELEERHWACWEKGKSKLCPCLNNN